MLRVSGGSEPENREESVMAGKKIVNDLNVEQLFKSIETFRQKSELAKCKFRATNQWSVIPAGDSAP
jgi:hypothetical protein